MRIPERAPTYRDLARKYLAQEMGEVFRRVITAGIGACVEGRYVHWDKLRHLDPPPGLSTEQWWLGIKLARSGMWKELPLRDVSGRLFQYAMPDEAQALAHQVTQDASGSISISEQVVNPDTRERYIVSSLIDEAISSSQLEGAATTTPVAREMIRSGREPRDRDERMILNNYRAIRAIRGLASGPLDPGRVLEIHRIMTEGTLDVPDAAGRFRRESEYRVVVSPQSQLLHEPPPAGELPDRLDAMCAFANDRETFVHPAVRAILLHFWLAYDHPFIDGNGRTARALFFWSMLAQGYWLCEYLPISSILRKAPARYARSFLHTETDENDATYFILSQLEVVQQAITGLHRYLRRKAAEVIETERLLRRHAEFNHRQLALLSHAIKHPGARYTIRSHQTSHNVVYETARKDLLDLAGKALLDKRKIGKTYVFVAREGLAKLLHDLGQD